MKLSQKHVVIISVLGFITMIALSSWIFLAIKSNSLHKEALAIHAEILKNKTDATYLNSIRTALKNSKSDIALLEKRFINPDEVPQFIDLLESKASAVGVKADFGSIDIHHDETSNGTLRIRMTAIGSWNTVTTYINTLESLPYALNVDSVVLSKSDNKNSTWNVGMELIQYLAEKK